MSRSPTPVQNDSHSRRHALLVELLALSEAQEAAALAGEVERLDDLLHQRARLVARLVALDVAGEPEDSPASLRVAMRDLVAKVQGCDHRCAEALAARRDAIARELRTIDAGRGALGAYAGLGSPLPRYQDREA